jgi:hypothetical protein
MCYIPIECNIVVKEKEMHTKSKQQEKEQQEKLTSVPLSCISSWQKCVWCVCMHAKQVILVYQPNTVTTQLSLAHAYTQTHEHC